MQKIFLLLLVLFSSTVFLLAQDKYQFGTREVRVPGPEGFANVMTRFPRVTGRALATEDPGNEVLAVYVPETFVPRLQESEEIDLGLYTKVSVSRAGRASEITPEFYRYRCRRYRKEPRQLFGSRRQRDEEGRKELREGAHRSREQDQGRHDVIKNIRDV